MTVHMRQDEPRDTAVALAITVWTLPGIVLAFVAAAHYGFWHPWAVACIAVAVSGPALYFYFRETGHDTSRRR